MTCGREVAGSIRYHVSTSGKLWVYLCLCCHAVYKLGGVALRLDRSNSSQTWRKVMTGHHDEFKINVTCPLTSGLAQNPVFIAEYKTTFISLLGS